MLREHRYCALNYDLAVIIHCIDSIERLAYSVFSPPALRRETGNQEQKYFGLCILWHEDDFFTSLVIEKCL